MSVFCNDSSKLKMWKVKKSERSYSLIRGILSNRKGYYHHWISYNYFEEKDKKTPKNATQQQRDKKFIRENFCGDKEPIGLDNEYYQEIRDEVEDKYFIRDNGGRPFLFYVTSDDVASIHFKLGWTISFINV